MLGFQEIGTRGTQAAAEAMDKNGNLFFGMMDPIALACWVSYLPTLWNAVLKFNGF